DGPADRIDRLRFLQPAHGNRAACKKGPGLARIASDAAVDSSSGLRKGSLAILPALKRTPDEAPSAQAVGLGVGWVQGDGPVEQVQSLAGARVGMLAKEEHGADEALPGIQALGRFPLRTVVLGGIHLGLDAADHTLRDLVLNREDVLERSIVTIRPEMISGLRFD